MNFIVIIGRLTRDPELKTVTVDGTQKTVCNFSVAVDRDFGDGVDFFNCVIWDKRAEWLAKFFKKGKEIALTGSYHMDPYKDKDGNDKVRREIRVSKAYFTGKKEDDAKTGTGSQVPAGFEAVDNDDDIPF